MGWRVGESHREENREDHPPGDGRLKCSQLHHIRACGKDYFIMDAHWPLLDKLFNMLLEMFSIRQSSIFLDGE